MSTDTAGLTLDTRDMGRMEMVASVQKGTYRLKAQISRSGQDWLITTDRALWLGMELHRDVSSICIYTVGLLEHFISVCISMLNILLKMVA